MLTPILLRGGTLTPTRPTLVGVAVGCCPRSMQALRRPPSQGPMSVPVPDATVSAPGSVPLPDGDVTAMAPSLPVPRRLAPATAPMRVGPGAETTAGEEGDYFGVAAAAAAAARASGVAGAGRSGRTSGLRTPPRTREGSASRSSEEDASSREAESELNEESKRQRQSKSPSPPPDEEKPSPTRATPFSAGPTTPDSNPTRPDLGRAISGPAATTSSSGSRTQSPTKEYSSDTVLQVAPPRELEQHESGDPPATAAEDPDPPDAFSSNSPLRNDADEEIARPVLPHASTVNNPSEFSTAVAYTSEPYPDYPDVTAAYAYAQSYSDPAALYAYAQSVPAAAAPRRALARQMSAPLPRSAADTLGTLAPATPTRARALSSDPGRDARGGGRPGTSAGVVHVEDAARAHGAPSKQKLSASTSLESSLANGVITSAGPGPIPIPHPHLAPRRSSKEDGRRAQREERAFAAREFLAPPYPPDELGRRRALYKFNIMNTGPDLNFDRIAHLAKLVFNTKGVLISVVDGEEEWFKSEWGINKSRSLTRATSFSGHAILQRGDEPMIVLDSRLDWRFAKSPLVLGPPNIRFYAGAPLRTHDGFNIGCLALVDDAPREDFTPRQRHTLKEFAAIAMREMELWRDKIQLRIRDRIQTSMEQFSRECLEIDSEAAGQGHAQHKGESKNESEPQSQEPNAIDDVPPPPPPHANNHERKPHTNDSDPPDLMGPSSSMDTVYDRAAKLVQRTLDVEGVVVMDVSHYQVIESMSAEGTVSIVLHHGDPDVPTSTHTLSAEEYARLNDFFARYPEGKISEGIVPPTLRVFLPAAHIQYALVVPIYNIDKRPFALLCAWNASEQSKRFLEGHELSYLRAIGVIILSAVLKRRMILADKAKSLFISNISHELRTPLHGILAAAELLGDSPLNHSQLSFLETVQACGTSLVETVNHVLDFTKLSGNSKAGGVENVIVPTKVDLMQLVEEAVDGCWIGHRARTAIMGDTGIGSVYSPPEESSATKQLVETVVDIGWRKGGWSLKCEKGGIRRVLMNVFGNSLKFTTNGYVHVILRELPRSGDEAPNETKVELVVLDTGKGISENFRKNQLFHPFSQENPLQTGTGLGLAIVNSIVKSESVNGKVDVWSEEGIGTEIKVIFTAQIPSDEETVSEMEPFKFDDPIHPVTVSLVGFEDEHKGVQLLHTVIQTYLVSWWGFEVRPPEQDYGEIVILNEDVEPVKKATAERNTSRPFVILSTLRGNPGVMAIASEHERIGGFCRIIYKPGGPSRLYALLKLCLHAIKIGRSGGSSPHQEHEQDEPVAAITHVPRRNSEETRHVWASSSRPTMSPRSSTAHPLMAQSWQALSSMAEKEEPPVIEEDGEIDTTINIGPGGTLLRSSMGTISSEERRFRVLVVEDNSILRNLLVKWLTSRGYDYRDAVDGRNGVKVYEEEGPFDVVLLDMSMPILDGIGATTEIRQMEARWQVNDPNGRPTRILALTGRSSLEDKRQAFEAGVDGYLVKPVAFKTLDEMFSKLGVQ
ncbi:Histidine kinase [Mycena venus]|uniref:histidine kinase n=1 Tax=Mycena venus TaxID=2733690 RepID=A0A8H7CBP2_9AGAR|nr:Histidine kinase [Mycena venus]